MFSHDHRLNPRILSPTSFDGMKPPLMGWSKEVTVFLAITDYQEFIPFLSAAASSKDIIESDVMFWGVLSDLTDEIKKKAADKLRTQSENKTDEVNVLTAEIANLEV